MIRSRLIRLATAAGAVVALGGCGASSLQAPRPQDIEVPTFEAAPRDSQMVDTTSTGALKGSITVDGAKGGSLTVGSFRLDIPAGAFKGTATVTMTQDDPSVLLCDFDVSPASANDFAVPATLTTKLPDKKALNDQMLSFDAGRKAWKVTASVPDPNRLELHSEHAKLSKHGPRPRAGW